VTPLTNAKAAQCQGTSSAGCTQATTGNCNAEQPSNSSLSFYYNGATTTDSLYSFSNIKVLNDLPKGLDSGTSGFARTCASAYSILML
jgi:hypothetical protein